MSRRILLLITDLQIGGTPAVVRELAIRLREPPGVEIEVACLAGWGPIADQLKDTGVPVTALGAASPVDFPRTLLRLIRLIRSRRFDTVFSFLLHANVMAAAASIMSPGARFLQSIQTTQPRPRWHWALQRFVQHAGERIAVPSASTADVASRRSGVPAAKLVVIHNAVDPDAFAFPPPSTAAPNGRIRVGFLGRLDPIKRVPNLVAAMTLLPAAELHIFGEGMERSRIESEIARLSLGDRVKLHGAVSSPQQALCAMDVLVLPSAAEGFGLVLIEAMAAGVPVVAADAPGIRDVVRDGVNGVLCGDASPAQIAAAVRVAQDRREVLIPQARRDVESRFGWPNVLAAYRRLLRLS